MSDNTEPIENQEKQVIEQTTESPEFVVRLSEGDDTINPEWDFNDTEVNTAVPVEETIETPAAEVLETEIEAEAQIPAVEVKEFNEEDALKFLKNKGFEIENIEDLKKPAPEAKKLSPTAEKYQEYVDKTGNESFSDFAATQKDWKAETPETVLKQYLKMENPTLSQRQIDFLYNREYSVEGLDSDLDEDAIFEKEINSTKDLNKAITLLEKQKEEFMVVRGADEMVPEVYKSAKTTLDQIIKEQEESTKKGNAQSEYFVTKTNELFSPSFEGFKVEINGESFRIKPTDVAATKNEQLNISNFTSKFIDENTGLIKDPVGYHKALFFARNPESAAKHFFELGQAKQKETDDKISKNIVTDVRTAQPPSNLAGMKIRVVE